MRNGKIAEQFFGTTSNILRQRAAALALIIKFRENDGF